MELNKKIIGIGLFIGILSIVSGYIILNKVNAEAVSNYPPLIQALVDKFQLNTNQVDEVVTTYRNQRREQMQSDVASKLAQAVTDKKITAEQKTQLEQMLATWRNEEKSDWTTLSQDERRKKIEAHRELMHSWAEQNNVDIESILGGNGMGVNGKGGMGRGRGMGYGMQ